MAVLYINVNGVPTPISGFYNAVPQTRKINGKDLTEDRDLTAEDVGALPNTVDYIVEQGVSDIWTYRKWNSGIAECWGTKGSQYYASTSTSGNIHYISIGTWYFLSGLFIDTPIVQCSFNSSNNNMWCWGSGISKNYIAECYAARGGAATDIYGIPQCYAIGRWK